MRVGAPALYGVGEVGCCCRLRSSETSWMSPSSGACLPVSLAFMSGMHVFPRGHPMPVGQACLGGTFSVFEIQPLLLNLGPMFVHCLKLCQLPGRLCHPSWFSLFLTLSRSSPYRQQSKEVTPLYSAPTMFHTPGSSHLPGNSSPPASPAARTCAGLWP